MSHKIAAAAALAVTAVSASAATHETYTFHHEHVLGTSLEITVHAANHHEAARAEEAALRLIDARNASLSAWDKNSELSRWMNTRGEAIAVSPELLHTLSAFEKWRVRTNGALDASAETAVRLWTQATAQGRVPSALEIEQAKLAMQQQHWLLDHSAGTATRLTDTPLALASFTKSMIAGDAANAALSTGASGVTLNLGGDIVTRGTMTQIVDIANPLADAENDHALEQVTITDKAIATSGSYRRGFSLASQVGAPQFSHLIDPRSAQPAGSIVSSTVIANDAETAGALATAFSVMSPRDSAALAAKTPGVAYLLITAEGQQIESESWKNYRTGGIAPVAYVAKQGAKTVSANPALWNQGYEAVVQLDLARIADARYKRPFVAVWVEDKDHFPVRTLALWFDKTRWLPELKAWYRDDQIRKMAESSDLTTTSSATRAPGKYTLRWDGKDNDGKLVKAGTYTICVEVAREHGTYQILRHELNANGQPQQAALGNGTEIASATLDYRKR